MDNPLKPSKLPEEKNPRGIHDWCTLAIQESEAFVRSQDGFDEIENIKRAIMGTSYDDKMRPNAISSLNLNHMGKIALDLSSSLTDIKPFFEYRTTNVRFEQQAQMGQKLASAWWGRRNIDLRFADVVRYCMIAGSGFAHLTYNTDLQDLDLIAEDPRDVLPIRPNDMISIQNAFGVVIRRERTVNYLRHMYPRFMNQIHADRDGSYAALARRAGLAQKMGGLGMVSGFMGNLFSQLGGRPSAAPLTVPVSDVFTIYVKDDSVNETNGSVVMGDATQNWSYIVKPGDPLYPRGRCIVMTRSVKEPLYDGPNIYWHGMFPVPKLSLDPWPWSWFGKSPLKDILGVQREIDRTARGISDTMEKNWRPDLIADSKTIAKATSDRIDTRKAGLRLRIPPGANANSVMLKYPEMQGVVGGIQWLELLVTAQKELAGTQELSNLVQLGQIPSSETIERMTESWSPAIRLRSRVMEAFLREVAMITLMNFFQFYTRKQRIAVLGPSGQTFEDFDYDPDTLIPDMISTLGPDDHGGPLPRYTRAKEFITYFTYQIAPGSLLAASEVTDKLMYLQLSRMGFVDAVTLLEKLKVANIAPANMLEAMGPTIIERLQWQQQAGIQMNGGPAGMQGQPGGGPGRPASAQAMPRITLKES